MHLHSYNLVIMFLSLQPLYLQSEICIEVIKLKSDNSNPVSSKPSLLAAASSDISIGSTKPPIKRHSISFCFLPSKILPLLSIIAKSTVEYTVGY